MANSMSTPLSQLSIWTMIQQTLNHKRAVFVIFMIGGILTLLYLHFAKEEYEAMLRVGPGHNMGAPIIGGELGGLAGAGLLSNLGLGETEALSLYDRYRIAVYSNTLMQVHQEKEELVQLIFPEYWNSKTESWQRPSGFVNGIKILVKSILGYSIPDRPTPDLLRQRIKDSVVLQEDFANGTLVLTYRNRNSETAYRVLNIIHSSTDSFLRIKDKQKVLGRIDYLTSKLNETVIHENRRALAELLLAEEHNLMMISVEEVYSVDILDGPVSGHTPVSPNRPFAVVLAILLCSVAAICWPLAHPFLSKNRPL